MNPFFFMQMMNPFSFGCMPCSGLVSMPYERDLPFLNFPVIRNTSMDYLLDPNYALMNCQRRWMMQGGNGSTMLPGFTFPNYTYPQMQYPTLPGVQKPQTEEEKEAEKKKQEETKKPEAEKAKHLYETFNKLKQLTEDKNNNLPTLSEELCKKAEEAMKKETAEEQLEAMKEVMSDIPVELIRKTVLSDANVREQLRKAGYNFNYAKNKYSLKHPDIKDNDFDGTERIKKLHEEIKQKEYNELAVYAGQLADKTQAKKKILSIISTWNDSYKSQNERSIIRLVGNNLPTGNDAIAKLKTVQDNIRAIAEALVTKADDYTGYKKITAAKNELKQKIATLTKPNGCTKANIDSLATSFDKLYARIRMQEAVAINSYINKNFADLNEVNADIINDKMVLEETQKDLAAEGITAPSKSDLDVPPTTPVIEAQNHGGEGNNGGNEEDLDTLYANNPEGLVKALVSENELFTTEIGKQTLYKTKAFDGYVKYFGIDAGKIVEYIKTPKGGLKKVESENSVTAADIKAHNAAVGRATELRKAGLIRKLTLLHTEYPIFKGAYENSYFILKDNNLYKISDCKNIQDNVSSKHTMVSFSDKDKKSMSVDKLSIENGLTEFVDTDIKTKAMVDKEKKEKELADVRKIESHQFSSLNDIAESNKMMDELSVEATGKKGNFEKTAVAGYFFCKGKNRYYRYYVSDGKLHYLPTVKSIDKNGIITRHNGTKTQALEVFIPTAVKDVELINKIQEYGASFRTCLNGDTSEAEYEKAHRQLNTIIGWNKPEYTVNFIKGYKNNWCLWSDSGICKQIVTEGDLEDGDESTFGTKKYYIQQIAKLMLTVVDNCGFDRTSADYKTLQELAGIKNIEGSKTFNITKSFSLKQKAETLDKIIDKVIESYDKK